MIKQDGINKLSEAEYLKTMAEPMTRLLATASAPFSFWDYFDSIPAEDFAGHDCSDGSVTYVWQDPDKRFQHVLVDSDDQNVFMALVLDLVNERVLGHRLLNLNREYGIENEEVIE